MLALISSRAIIYVLPLITLPVTFNYLGAERFGMYMAVISFAAIYSLTEGGVSNSVITAAARASANRDARGIKQVLASSIALVTPGVAVAIVASILMAWLTPWQSMLNLSSPAVAHEAAQCICVLGVCIAFSFLTGVGMKLRRGMNQAAAVAFWETVGAVATVPVLFLALHFRLGSPWLVACLFGAPQAAAIVGLVVFLSRNPEYIPVRADIRWAVAVDLLRSSVMFLATGLAAGILLGLDAVFIARMGGPEAVGPYMIAQRLFLIPFILSNFWFYSTWPSLAEAAHKRDFAWVRRTFWTAVLLASGFALVLSSLLALFFSPVTRLWIGTALPAEPLLMGSMIALACLQVFTNACSTLMFAIEARRQQILISLASFGMGLVLKLALLSVFMPAGAAMATALTLLLAQALPYLAILPRRLSDSGSTGSTALAATSGERS